jgi:hypothetical protein
VPEQVPEPEGDGELVRVLACGLCGSDVEKIGRAPVGTVLGHEVVAETPDARPHPGRGGTVTHRVGLEGVVPLLADPPRDYLKVAVVP